MSSVSSSPHAISRYREVAAGSGELAAAGIPSLLVPYPHATADHQYKNARHFADRGGAVVVREEDLRMREQVTDLLDDDAALESMRAAMLGLARPRAADEIAEELIALGSA